MKNISKCEYQNKAYIYIYFIWLLSYKLQISLRFVIVGPVDNFFKKVYFCKMAFLNSVVGMAVIVSAILSLSLA